MAVKLATTLVLLISAPAVMLQLRDSLQTQEITNGPSNFLHGAAPESNEFIQVRKLGSLFCVFEIAKIFSRVLYPNFKWNSC